MKESDFVFIEDTTLRENVKNVCTDILSLTAMVLQADQGVQDCLRKTIIIYTASAVEALLLWKIKERFGAEKIALKDEPKHHILHTLHTDYTREQKDGDEGFQIALTKITKEKKDADKLDFNTMIITAKNEELLPEGLLDGIDKVRKMRNKIHIGGLKSVIKTYPQEDVDFTLEVLEAVTQSIQ